MNNIIIRPKKEVLAEWSEKLSFTLGKTIVSQMDVFLIQNIKALGHLTTIHQ